MGARRLTFRVHALARMFERAVRAEDVRQVLEVGRTIETYPDDLPYPSRLVLGWVRDRPLHVVVADDETNDVAIIVTVYEPEPARWESGFEKRRKR